MILAAVVPASILTPDEFRNFLTVVGLFLVFTSMYLGFRATLTGRKVKKAADDASAVRYQVENNHQDEDGNVINLREESDERHGDNSSKLDSIMKALTNLRGSTDKNFELIRVDIQRLNAHDDRDDQRLKDLEATQPKSSQS